MKDVYCFKKVFVNGCISLLCLFVFVGNSSAQNQVPPRWKMYFIPLIIRWIV